MLSKMNCFKLLNYGFIQNEEEEAFKDLAADDDDEEERFVDADKLEEQTNTEAEEVKPAASWVHHQNLEGLWNAKIRADVLCLKTVVEGWV